MIFNITDLEREIKNRLQDPYDTTLEDFSLTIDPKDMMFNVTFDLNDHDTINEIDNDISIVQCNMEDAMLAYARLEGYLEENEKLDALEDESVFLKAYYDQADNRYRSLYEEFTDRVRQVLKGNWEGENRVSPCEVIKDLMEEVITERDQAVVSLSIVEQWGEANYDPGTPKDLDISLLYYDEDFRSSDFYPYGLYTGNMKVQIYTGAVKA